MASAEARTHEGTGIELALVRELARLHSGDVGVESEEGAGTTFPVTVPFASAQLPPEHVDMATGMRPWSSYARFSPTSCWQT